LSGLSLLVGLAETRPGLKPPSLVFPFGSEAARFKVSGWFHLRASEVSLNSPDFPPFFLDFV